MTHLLASLHIPVDLVLRHAEVMLENAAYPQRRRLLILRHAQPLAGQVFRFRDPRVDVVRKLGLKKSAAGKNRQRDHVGSLGFCDKKG